jgi:hypothetical protein
LISESQENYEAALKLFEEAIVRHPRTRPGCLVASPGVCLRRWASMNAPLWLPAGHRA